MKKLLLALVVLTTAGQIMPLFRHYDDERPGLIERAVTAPARIVDPNYRYDDDFYYDNDDYGNDRRDYPNRNRRRNLRSSNPRLSDETRTAGKKTTRSTR